AGCVIVRKPGKLPYKTFQQTYSLEYGTDTIEVHQDAIQPGQNVVLMDDVLATGGTMAAAANLLSANFDANVLEAAFIIELSFLNGREKLSGLSLHSLIKF
ncbi:MAG: adenine phosphoribosyltransferase, partial [Nitrospinaceae bacterium]